MHTVKNIVNGSYFRELATVPDHVSWTTQRSEATWMSSDRAHQLARDIRGPGKNRRTQAALAVVSRADGWLVGSEKHPTAIPQPIPTALLATPKDLRASGLKLSCR